MSKIFLRFLRKFGLIQYLNLSFSHTIHGRSYRILVKGGVGLDHFFDAERWMKKLLTTLFQIQHQKAFLDVGVNVGQTLLTVRSVSNEISYFGFEPNPICVSYLANLIEANQLKATVYPVGLGNSNGLVLLYKDTRLPSDSTASMIKEFRDTRGKEEIFVPILTWQSSPVQAQSVQFGVVKIDVEGAEWEVISSLSEMIAQQRPIIICEILPTYTSDNVFRIERQQKILHFLAELNYSLYRIDLHAELVPLQTIEVHSNLADSNYVFAPKELSAAISKTL